MSNSPIFIGGHIKSGTSLMAALLDSHPDLLVFPEELFLFNKLSLAQNQEHSKFWDLFFNDLQINRLFSDKASGVFGNVDYTDFDAPKFECLCKEIWNKINNKYEPGKAIIECVFQAFSKTINASPSARWVEKTPTNEFHFNKLVKWYPNCKFIYMNRNPFHVYASVKRKRMIEKVPYSITHFISNYKYSQAVAEKLCKLYPGNFIVISFEELSRKQKATMDKVVDFCGLPYYDILLEPTKLGQPWLGNSMFRSNQSSEIIAEKKDDRRLNTLTNLEKQLIENLIVKNSWHLESNLYFMFTDFKRFLKTQTSLLIKASK